MTLKISMKDLPLWSDDEARQVLNDLCEEHGVPVDVLEELIQIQRENQHLERAHGIYDTISEALDRID